MLAVRQQLGGLGNRLFQWAYLYAQVAEGKIPDVYVQDYTHFQNVAHELRQQLQAGVTPDDRISLHVRRGDYVGNDYYVPLYNTDYYEKAIAQFPGERFLVFCKDGQSEQQDKSDLEWVKEKFKGEQFDFHEHGDEVDDFNTMAGCKGHIIANSSYSWWAAFVGGGETVSPWQWFSDGTRIPTPLEWHRI